MNKLIQETNQINREFREKVLVIVLVINFSRKKYKSSEKEKLCIIERLVLYRHCIGYLIQVDTMI